ncbi:flagellar basal body-associated protein FliL [Stappia sp. GBMRC 2046]|uniref:Flagellar protein FliL n=1 Tax=Stappia sediminis TaxID=2692190 RepID=A0A7X3S669_9HYPH|nr:flagellar basal body-associated FliL family protein [Stappia sediminis]MXN63722.1 flagellar basal body-associated protein FliL [Stappia sediminis]
MTAEADAVEPGQEQEGSAPGGGKRKKIALMGGGAAILLAIVGAAIYFISDGSSFSGAGGAGVDPQTQKPVVFYDLPEMTVNLSTDGRATYLKVRIALEVSDRATIDLIEPFLPRVLDAFQIYLRELRPTDLEGSSGLFRLKEELLRRINTAVYPARVEAVLFKEILIQ